MRGCLLRYVLCRGQGIIGIGIFCFAVVSYDRCGALYGSVVQAWKRGKEDLVPTHLHQFVTSKISPGIILYGFLPFCLNASHFGMLCFYF